MILVGYIKVIILNLWTQKVKEYIMRKFSKTIKKLMKILGITKISCRDVVPESIIIDDLLCFRNKVNKRKQR